MNYYKIKHTKNKTVIFVPFKNDKYPFDGKSQNNNLNANEGFVIILTSKLIICFIDGFTLKIKSQSIAYLLNGSEHIHWILDLESEVYSIWDLAAFKNARIMVFSKSSGADRSFWSNPKNLNFLMGARAVHLHLIYLYTCENPLFNGGVFTFLR